MSALAALLLAQAAAPAPPPVDWSTLPPLRYRRVPDAVLDPGYVRGEVAAGRCAAAVKAVRGWVVKVDLAVLGSIDGQPRRIVPRAIGCPTVEQFAWGLVSRMARDNVDTGGAEGWYRVTLSFAWQ